VLVDQFAFILQVHEITSSMNVHCHKFDKVLNSHLGTLWVKEDQRRRKHKYLIHSQRSALYTEGSNYKDVSQVYADLLITTINPQPILFTANRHR